jgi:hypothetical protein
MTESQNSGIDPLLISNLTDMISLSIAPELRLNADTSN